jgi:ParB/RepB/Spo0J family partition protein
VHHTPHPDSSDPPTDKPPQGPDEHRPDVSRDTPLALIDPDPDQPRRHFDPAAIDELAGSMAANGLAVPVLLRPAGERFVLVHGERRTRAARQLG